MTENRSYDGIPGGAEPELEDLVDAHQESLYRFAMSLTRSENDACDLVQDTFLAWATKRNPLRDPSKARSWLFTTLHRRFLEVRRRITRFPHLDLESTERELPEVEAEAVQRLETRELLEVLEQLDPTFRAPVAMFYLEDCSYNEIAEILEIPLGTVKSRIARGLGQLRQLVSRRVSTRVASGESS